MIMKRFYVFKLILTAKPNKDLTGLLWMTKRTFVDMRYKCKQFKKWGFRLSFPLYLSNLPGGVMTLGLSTVHGTASNQSWGTLQFLSPHNLGVGMSWGRAQIRWSTEIWNYNLLYFILYQCHPSIIDNRYVDCFVHVWKGRLSATATLPPSPLVPFYHIVLNF